MNPTLKRVIFWIIFIAIIVLVVWGMVVASNKGQGSPNAPVPLSTPVTSSDWSEGSSSAPVTIVEYADFECPACQAYAPVLEKLLAAEPSNIFFVYRYFPLPQHSNAIPAAEAAQAAGIEGKFWPMHDLLFANHGDWENLPDPTSVFVKYATTIGLNAAQFTKDLNSDAVKNAVMAGYQDAVKSNLSYTPTIFINGFRIDNPQSYDAFKQLIDNAAASTTNK